MGRNSSGVRGGSASGGSNSNSGGKSNEQIFDAYKNLLDKAEREYAEDGKMSETTEKRLINGLKWVEDHSEPGDTNSFIRQAERYAEDTGTDYILTKIKRLSAGLTEEKESHRDRMARLQSEYEESQGLVYNPITKRYEKASNSSYSRYKSAFKTKRRR